MTGFSENDNLCVGNAAVCWWKRRQERRDDQFDSDENVWLQAS